MSEFKERYVMFFQNIENVLREIASGMSGVGGGVILVCAVLFGCGTMFLDESNETFRKAKSWLVKAIVVGVFIFGAGTIVGFIQSLMSSSGFGM
ncbi:TrbC/VirB2 family protein [uncultured Clostridium sp.]|uniref:TrbC/VirB2 family protein n=1 Tax=uncultured Clostridium sp. TaxID=59620 RepID=UPI00261310AD|nr:TrbC/VirB2 family protein [uncultured Clostridium sp.]